MRPAITNAPHVPRARALIDAPAMVRNPLEVFERYRTTRGPTFTVHMGGGRPVIVSTDPGFAQHVLQKNWDNYQMSDIRVKRMGEFQGQGLLNSHGEAWKKKRKFLAPGFHPERLSALVPVQEQVLNDSLARLDAEAARGVVDISRIILWINFRLFGKSVFGSSMADDEIEHIASTIKAVQGFIVHQIVKPYMVPWYRLSGRSRRYQALRLDAEQVARRYIARRRREGRGGGDLLELMLNTPYPEPGQRMNEDQILVEALQLFVAGNETSPTALSWTFYLLGQHPSFITAMREEVDAVFGEGPLTFEGLQRLHLTRQILDEALRLYPSFWMMDRVAQQDDRIGSIRVPAGLTVLIYLFGLHRNTAVWTNPETFDPARFDKEAKKGRSPFAYLPFGGGPRKCIGSSMAIVQMLMVLATLVRRYDFELASSRPVEIQPMMILHPKSAIEMRVTRIR